MSIVSHSLVSSVSTNATQQYVLYRFTDHVGGITELYRRVDKTLDTDAHMLSMYSEVEHLLEQRELGEAIGRIENGEDGLTVVQGAVHNAQKALAKKLIYWMCREQDPYIVFQLETLINYIRSNYPGSAILTFLDLTAAEGQTLNNRINAVLDNRIFFEAFFDNRLEEPESENGS